MVNGKQTYADEETGFVFQKYSGFAPKAFIKEVKNRDFVRISLDPEQQSCTNLEKTLNEYDDSFEASRKNVFGKYDRLYKFARSVKKPKSNTEEEISDDEDEDAEKEAKEAKDIKETKDIQPKYNSCKMKLKMDWFYYYQGERLDKSNTNTVKKACTDSMTKNKNIDKEKRKALLGTLTFKLNFKDENDKTVQKDVKMDELEQDIYNYYRIKYHFIEDHKLFLLILKNSLKNKEEIVQRKLKNMKQSLLIYLEILKNQKMLDIQMILINIIILILGLDYYIHHIEYGLLKQKMKMLRLMEK